MTSEPLTPALTKTRKPRKTYSPAERAETLKLCQQPNASIPEIATLGEAN